MIVWEYVTVETIEGWTLHHHGVGNIFLWEMATMAHACNGGSTSVHFWWMSVVYGYMNTWLCTLSRWETGRPGSWQCLSDSCSWHITAYPWLRYYIFSASQTQCCWFLPLWASKPNLTVHALQNREKYVCWCCWPGWNLRGLSFKFQQLGRFTCLLISTIESIFIECMKWRQLEIKFQWWSMILRWPVGRLLWLEVLNS